MGGKIRTFESATKLDRSATDRSLLAVDPARGKTSELFLRTL
jgi:hypothetical protein